MSLCAACRGMWQCSLCCTHNFPRLYLVCEWFTFTFAQLRDSQSRALRFRGDKTLVPAENQTTIPHTYRSEFSNRTDWAVSTRKDILQLPERLLPFRKIFCRWIVQWYDMIYLLTAIGLSPGGSSTVHIYKQTIHRTIQNKQYIEQHNNFGRVRAVPRLG